MSKRKASELYGISGLKKRSDKVSAAAKMAKEIQNRSKILAKKEKKAYLASCGVDPKDILSGSSESDGSDFSDDTEVSLESVSSETDEENSEFKKVKKAVDMNVDNRDHDTLERNSWRHAEHDGRLKDTPAIDVNSVVVLDKLREVS